MSKIQAVNVFYRLSSAANNLKNINKYEEFRAKQLLEAKEKELTLKDTFNKSV